MEIQVADQRIFLFKDFITPEDAKTKSWEKKVSAFDAMSKVIGFLSRTKDEDFELKYQEHRYQPFWHVIATSKYVYDRSTTYQVSATGTEVQRVTLYDKDHEVSNGHFHIPTIEHCRQEGRKEVLVDGITGKDMPELQKYLSLSSQLATTDINTLVPQNSILVPPQARVSAIMRQTLSQMITGIQADTILEESVNVPTIDLYYRPIYAFQYRWISKNKDGILEVDGLTGEVKSGDRVFSEFFGKALDKNFLFDLGGDVAGMFIPGGSIAVKVAKQYMENKKE